MEISRIFKRNLVGTCIYCKLTIQNDRHQPLQKIAKNMKLTISHELLNVMTKDVSKRCFYWVLKVEGHSVLQNSCIQKDLNIMIYFCMLTLVWTRIQTVSLTLKAPIMTAANIYKYFFHCFFEKIRLDISYESDSHETANIISLER